MASNLNSKMQARFTVWAFCRAGGILNFVVVMLLMMMFHDSRVHDLFLSKDGQMPGKFSFKDYICKQDPHSGDPTMKVWSQQCVKIVSVSPYRNSH